MKKNYFILLLISFGSINLANAQQKVALQSNGTTLVFGGANAFVNAYTASTNGDTLYLPGGTIPYPPTINKGLVIIGAGHYPDSTLATGKTVLTGNLTITQDADKLWLEGIEITGNITFANNSKVDSVTIKRCKFNDLNYQGTAVTPCTNNNIIQNIIIGSVSLTNATSSLLSNNVINSIIVNANNIGISNNILLYSIVGYTPLFNNVDDCFISNNIIFRTYCGPTYFHTSSDLNTFSNNIFALVPAVGNNTFTNNYNTVDLSTVFVNQLGTEFSYNQNYHLVSPATYVGSDSTQVGIYGGLYPFKDGAVPQNPHIQTKSISTQTNTNGDLNIQIKVRAQNE